MSQEALSATLKAIFPNIASNNHDVTSPFDDRYNCIAHAGSANDMWWWPVKAPGVYWPLDDYMEETMDCFVAAYSSLGYTVCNDDELETGVQKVALYADQFGKPTHAARQLEDGSWTSKLGRSQDIRHANLSVLEGKDGFGRGYGQVALLMARGIL